MTKQTYKFSSAATDFYFDSKFSQLKELVDQKNTVVLTDENVFDAHKAKFKNWNTIVLKAGEQYKLQQTADAVIDQLIDMQADRKTILVGVGGGVVTDLAGYIASVYMRGVRFGFVPTTVLGIVDASIGGKNGVDVGVYKNMVGTIRQPAFILHDYSLLSTLPDAEWRNGFAEIIKHACIRDAAMFRELGSNSLDIYRRKKAMAATLFRKNAALKAKLVQQDEFEQGERKLLNFGHTLGHALENQYELSHGQAVSIGMAYACRISEELTGFRSADQVTALIERYGLPAFAAFNLKKVMGVLQMDKKKEQKTINYILLEKVGKAVIHPLELDEISGLLASFK